MSDLDKKPQKRDDIASQELGDEVMLYDSVNEQVHVLNHTAYFIWKLCDGNNTLQDIRKKMISQFTEISDSAIINDIQSVINDFLLKKLLY
jgi:hypothetical protein